MGLVAYGMWNLPGPGIEPVFPALAAGFLTTGPPGKSWQEFFFFNKNSPYTKINLSNQWVPTAVREPF